MDPRFRVLAAFPIALAACDSGDDSGDDSSHAQLEIYDPAGALQTSELHAPRLDRLDDAVICQLSDYLWEANRILPEIERSLAERYPNATFVSYTELPDAYGANPDELVAAVTEAECEAVIVASAA